MSGSRVASEMLYINARLAIPEREISLSAIRAQGNGGQNVNKVSSAIHLRFDIRASSLPPVYQQRLLAMQHHLITDDGVVVIKSQSFRTQAQNRDDALARLAALIRQASEVAKPRRATAPSRGARRRRTDDKTRRGSLKSLRGKVIPG